MESYLAQETSLDTVTKLLASPIEAIYDRLDGHDAKESEADHALKNFWKELFYMVRDIPHDTERHQRMFQLFESLQARAGRSTPSGLEGREPWKSGGLWKEVHMLGQAERHDRDVWLPNKYRTGMGSQSQSTKVQYVNFIALMAKLTQADISDSSMLSLSYFRWGIEDDDKRCSSHREDVDVMIAAAAVWIKYAGCCWFEKIRSGNDWRVHDPGRVLECKSSIWAGDTYVVNLDRWILWKESFRQISLESVPGEFEDDTKAMAEDAVEVMQKIEDRQMISRHI